MAIYLGNKKVSMRGIVFDNSKFTQLVDKSITEVTAKDLEGATSIGSDTFKYCSKLKSITFPNTVKSISSQAFWGCNQLEVITIPKSITSFSGGSIFEQCSKLKTIYYEGTLEDWCNISFSSSGSTPLYARGNVYMNNTLVGEELVIPNTITILKPSVFCKWTIKSVIIHNGVTSIGEYVFYNCTSLVNITIPNSVKAIGKSALDIGLSTNKATIRMLGSTPPTIQSNTIGSNVGKIIVDPGTLSIWQNATNWSAKASIMEEEVV